MTPQIVIQIPIGEAFHIALIMGIGIAFLGLLAAVCIISAVVMMERADTDFEHINQEDLNEEIEIRDDFNLAVKTKPTNENKTQNR